MLQKEGGTMSEKKKKSCLARLLTTCLILVLIGLVGFNLLQRKAANYAAGKTVTSSYLKFGDVSTGTPYQKEISVTDFSLSELISMGTTCRYAIHDGTVSLI